MHRIRVKSRNVVSVGYDVATSILEFEFKHGRVYQYFDVPISKYETLLAVRVAGQSVGYYLKVHIQNEGYIYREI